jgi:hypothetical protein
MLLIGFVMLLVGIVYLVKKVKLRAKVAAAHQNEEEAKQFTIITSPSQVPKQPIQSNIPNGHPGNTGVTAPRQRRPTETDLYENNNNQKQSLPEQEVIVEDLAHYAPPKASENAQVPRVFFPNNSIDGANAVIADSTYTTPLTRLQKSPQKTLKDSTSEIVPKLENRGSAQISFASEPVVIATPQPEGQGPIVPEAASYAPISLTKMNIKDYEQYGGSAVT